MNDTQRILRNWNILWTIGAVLVSLVILFCGLKYNFIMDDGMGWGVIQLTEETNNIDKVVKVTLQTDAASGVYFQLFVGLFGFGVWCLLLLPVWETRDKLIGK